MKEFLKNYWPVIVFNLFITLIFVGGILYTLTYKSVPVQSQHLWYLKIYLTWDHAFATGIWVFTEVLANVFLYFKCKEENKKDENAN